MKEIIGSGLIVIATLLCVSFVVKTVCLCTVYIPKWLKERREIKTYKGLKFIISDPNNNRNFKIKLQGDQFTYMYVSHYHFDTLIDTMIEFKRLNKGKF